MKMSGSKAILESFLKENVKVIFGYPGGAIMPFYDALYHYEKKIRHILVRHEQGASHAAEGYARITGEPGVCVVTSGPGATNLVTGIADAMMDSVPLVCVTGQVAKAYLGTDAFQETDVMGVTAPITKWNYQVTDAFEIADVLAKAFYIARSGRPGPVVVDITKNAQFESCDFRYPKKINLPGYVVPQKGDEIVCKEAAQLINSARKPYVLIGHGVLISKAQAELKQFLEKGGVPAASTLHGLSALPTSHPNYVGMLGMHGNYAPNVLTNEADVIIAVGMRFDDRVTGRLKDYATKAKVIHIDIDPAEMNKNVPVAIELVGDAKLVLREITKHLKRKNRRSWFGEFKSYAKKEYEKVTKKEFAPTTPKVKMAEAIDMLSKKTKGKAVIVADVGQHQMIAARFYRFADTNSYITSGGAGTMGFGVPAAMGAKVAAPKRQVIAVVGDGRFQMTLQELGTIAQEKLPVKIVILNNNYLGMVRQWQQMFFEKRYSFTYLKNPDFIAIAKGFGIKAEKVEKREQVSKALDRMLKSDNPYLLDIAVETEHNVFPMVPTGASVTEIRLE